MALNTPAVLEHMASFTIVDDVHMAASSLIQDDRIITDTPASAVHMYLSIHPTCDLQYH